MVQAAPSDGWIVRLLSADARATVVLSDRASLVRRAAAGDEHSFEALIRAAGDRLLGSARKILRDPAVAEDAVQECVIVAWRTLPTLRDADRFDAWLYKILVSCCYAEARRVQRFAAYVRELRVDQDNSDEVEQIAERELLDHAFARLTPAHRAVIVLHHYAQFPLTEVASIVGVTPGTARSRLHYGLRAMRAAIEAADRPIIREITQ